MSIAARIISLRKKQGLSQEKLAEKLLVSRQTISKWDSGHSAPDYNNIKALCNFLNVKTDYLMNGDVDKEKTKSFIIGFALLIMGINLFITFIILLIKNPHQLNETSSMIEINGYGLLGLCSVGLFILAMILIYRRKKKI